MENVDDFIENLLIEKGITDVEPDIKAELKKDMKIRLLDQIGKAAILQLSEEKAIELANLVDRPDFTAEKKINFIEDSGVDLTKIASDTMARFRDFYLGNMEQKDE